MTATAETTPVTVDAARKWLALYVLCLGEVLTVRDSTIGHVALPSIQARTGLTIGAAPSPFPRLCIRS